MQTQIKKNRRISPNPNPRSTRNPNPNPNPKRGGLPGLDGHAWRQLAVRDRHLRALASSSPHPSTRHELIVTRARPLSRVCAPSCVRVVCPLGGASARTATSHGALAEPLDGPRARRTQHHRGRPRYSGTCGQGVPRISPLARRGWERKRSRC
jgi:hypothetical protein